MPRHVERDEVQRMMAAGAQLAEVLPRAEYEEWHLPGAIHLPLRHIETQARDRLDPERPVIVYCWDSA
jgi:rhodanese-related sulfurtransferase